MTIQDNYKKDVSVIIVNYNTIDMTRNCINSIFALTQGIMYEVILVDNNSTDGSKELFSKYDNINYIYLNENVGFGRANNIGIKMAKGRNVLFLNSDTKLINNAIKLLSDYLDSSPEIGIVGGNLYDVNGKPTHSYLMYYPSIYFELSGAFLKLPDIIRFGKNREFNYTSSYKDVLYVTGADLMIKHHIIEKYGAFNPYFFMYFEETELCYRVREAGYRIVSNPNAKIYHFQGASVNKVISDIKINSKITYFRLTASKTYFKKVFLVWKFRLILIIITTFLLKHNHYKNHIKSYRKISKLCSHLLRNKSVTWKLD